MSQSVKNSSNKLTKTQWALVATTSTAALVAGPIVVATTAIGTATGLYASNALGWNDGDE